jgi:hypothetical protein
MGHEFVNASVQDNDWLGTSALDNPGHQGLEELVGLDPKEWAILGLDLYGGSREGGFGVLAVRRGLVKDGGGDPALAAGPDGTVPRD